MFKQTLSIAAITLSAPAWAQAPRELKSGDLRGIERLGEALSGGVVDAHSGEKVRLICEAVMEPPLTHPRFRNCRAADQSQAWANGSHVSGVAERYLRPREAILGSVTFSFTIHGG